MKQENLNNYGSPRDWRVAQLKDLCERITKGSTPTSYGYSYTTTGIRFIKAENINANGFASTTTNYIDEETNAFLRRSILKENDLLFSIAGTIGRVGLVRPTDLPANTNQALAIIRLLPGLVDPKYLFYFLKSDSIQREALKRIVGVGRSNLSLTDIGELEVPLAPLDHQKRIVEEIEKHFSRLDEAVANLKRVKANLKRYKAAVLKAAVEGKLTEDWRNAHPDVEPASELLKRILAERHAKWSGNGKYKEPNAADSKDLPSLPENWTWATVEQVSYAVQYGSSAKTSEDPTGIPVLRMGNIVEGKLQIDELKYLPKSHDEFPELLLEPGDVLFNRTNSAALVGKTAVFQGNPKPCSFASYLIRVRLLNGCLPEFLAYYVNSVFGRAWIASVVSQQVGQANVNGTKLQALVIPLPPFAEQHQIVAEMERRVSVIEELNAVAKGNLRRAERLQEAVLRDAFKGRLTLDSN